MEYLFPALISLLGTALGFFIGKNLGEKTIQVKIENAKSEASQIMSGAKIEADSIRKEADITAKERVLKMKSDASREIDKKRKATEAVDHKLKQRENALKQNVNNFKNKEKEFDKQKTAVTSEMAQIDKKKKDADDAMKKLGNEQVELKKRRKQFDKESEKSKEQLAAKLEAVAGLSAEDAKQQLIETMTKKAETDAMAYVKEKMDEAKQTALRESKKIIIQTIQRTAAEQAIENAVTVFNLDSDDIKGQIIGREGRNIRALEAATGIEIIVDDTPEAVIISGYDPLRREIARLSLKRLVADGRIHPARIEEIVNKTRKQLEQEIIEIGERTVIELNIHGLHPQLIRLVGKMRFRSSYGQNLLQHSKETAKICSIMASELGLTKKSVLLAKRAGLLHDIGKVAEDYDELSHAIAGMKLCEKYKEKGVICNAVGAHHDEIEMTHMISPIVQACDAISGSRPGARREILESYLQRIKDLEDLASSYEGVQKAYAIQAGRELRVIVESEKVSDQKVDELSFEISQKIQSEMQYPGQIKVTVIREKRAINFAK